MPEKITSPYNFVPLSHFIYFPKWADKVSHDIPFKEGFSGSLQIKITANTPVLVGGKPKSADSRHAGEVHFFEMNNMPTIPGSSLKGMTRAVLEIISFGKMQRVNDQRLGIRDISCSASIGDNYIHTGQKAGFLRLNEKTGQTEIVPCTGLAKGKSDDLGNWINDSTSIADRYRKAIVKANNHTTQIQHHLPTIRFNLSKGNNLPIANPDDTGSHEGIVVFTGPISQKKHDFVFFDRDESSPIKIRPQTLKDFLQIHGEDSCDKNINTQKSPWCGYWRKQFFNHQEIPVFYRFDKHKPDQVKSIGLAYMYKLAYNYSIGETIDYTNPEHANPDKSDLAELILGKIHPDENKPSLKSRVSFGSCRLQGEKILAAPMAQFKTTQRYGQATILNGPKPTYFPNYITQETNAAGDKVDNKQQYRTYMQHDSEIRGWKRYPVRNEEEINIPEPSGAINANNRGQESKATQVKLFPLQKGSVFAGTTRFHNLTRLELGALIWVLKWGFKPDCYHAIGMGKPFGLGQIKLDITKMEAQANDPNENPLAENNLEKLCKEFEQHINTQYNQESGINWLNSPQMQQLLAMANPTLAQANKGNLAYMPLNDFVEAKKDHLVLPPYISMQKDDKEIFSRPQRPLDQRSASYSEDDLAAASAESEEKATEQVIDEVPTIVEEINPYVQWVDKQIQEIMAAGSDEFKAITGKQLAQRWQQADETIKPALRVEIAKRWSIDFDWWNKPNMSKKMTKTRKIYDEEI